MTPSASLWLFDIDRTLVDTGGAGMASLMEAAENHFGSSGPELDLAGATDAGVFASIFAHYGREAGELDVSAFLTAYLGRLEWNLAHGGYPGRLLPGVVGMLDRLAGEDDVTIGLLTGNAEEGARAKTRHYGIDHHFGFGAFGCEHADRNLLGPLALERASTHAGRRFTPEETLVIGDTPKDIACAAAIGARCLAVETGAFSAAGLPGADRVVATLEDEAAWSGYLLGET